MPLIRCDFCSKDEELGRLYHGAHAYICARCLAIINQLELSHMVSLEPSIDTHTNIYPVSIKTKLDEHVIKQDRAKKVLAVAVYNHYKRISQDSIESKIKLNKSNILLIGPTGSGKTLLAETLASLMKVPFGIADATSLSETGYVGDDVESILAPLLINANRDVELAERGIVYIDEIDKIARRTLSGSKDVSGEGVQRGLLKILEGSVVNVPISGSKKNGDQIKMNTSNILFILGGAFEGLDDLLDAKTDKKSIGFLSTSINKADTAEYDILRSKVTPEDLVKYGFLPEFIGRIPVIATLNTLSESDLVQILTEPTNSLVKQYQELFRMDSIKLNFTDKALKEIAKLAFTRKTGARGLKSIIENSLLDLMYESPSNPVEAIEITDQLIQEKCNAQEG